MPHRGGDGKEPVKMIRIAAAPEFPGREASGVERWNSRSDRRFGPCPRQPIAPIDQSEVPISFAFFARDRAQFCIHSSSGKFSASPFEQRRRRARFFVLSP